MAAVTAAMLRPPATGHESPYFAGQRINYKPTDAQIRRNTSPLDNSIDANPEYFYGTIGASGASTLSKSMKYAETWLYGTVRGSPIPVRPSIFPHYADVANSILVTSPQSQRQNYAVIICTCPEYLNGTKKSSSSKVSICKKCKGSRLPIVVANGTLRGPVMGGTLRGTPPIHSKTVSRAGTVRLTSTNKSRPSILGLTSQTESTDPYDLMRRTRLASPVESHSGCQFSILRSRARSSSPPRVRSRKRSPTQDTLSKRSQSICRVQNVRYQDLNNYQNVVSRRSILECEVNPYELINTNSVSSKASLNINAYDDIDVATEKGSSNKSNGFSLKAFNKKSLKHNGPYASVQAVGGQRVRVIGNKQSSVVNNELIYDDVEVHNKSDFLIAEKRIDSVIHCVSFQDANNDQLNANKISFETFREKINKDNKSLLPMKHGSPKRPPRKQKTESLDDHKVSKIPKDSRLLRYDSATNLDNSKQHANDSIKSILKKSRTGEIKEVPRVKELVVSPPSPSKTSSGSQFYIPTPPTYRTSSQNNLTRKKVQFLVENIPIKDVLDFESEVVDVPCFENNNFINENKNEMIENLEISTPYTGKDNLETKLDLNVQDYYKNVNENDSIVQVLDLKKNDQKVECNPLEDIDNLSCVSSDSTNTVLLNEVKCSPDSIKPLKSILLRRSESERAVETNPRECPIFLDSLALRSKPARVQSSAVFAKSITLINAGQNMVIPNRKNLKPAPPPPSGVSPYSSQELNSVRENQYEKISNIVLNGTTDDNDQEKQHCSESNVIVKVLNENKEGEQLLYKQSETPLAVDNKSHGSDNGSVVSANNNLSIIQNDERTILKVSEDVSHYDIAKKISSSGSIQIDEPQKTSIEISGDDCYSTVNVNTDTHIYKSSVILSTQEEILNDKATVTISITNSKDHGRRRNSSQIYIQYTNIIFPLEMDTDNTTLLILDYDTAESEQKTTRGTNSNENVSEVTSTAELGQFLKDPVEAVKRNLVPHVCGKALTETSSGPSSLSNNPVKSEEEIKNLSKNSFVAKLLEDPMLGHLAEGLESELVAKLIENSLLRLKKTKSVKEFGEDEETMSRLIDVSLSKLQENVNDDLDVSKGTQDPDIDETTCLDNDNVFSDINSKRLYTQENNCTTICSASYESMEYDSGIPGNIIDFEPLSDCYNASASELSTEDEANSTRSKFYQMLVDATLSEIEIANNTDDEHHYESIRLNSDPIYEEIGDIPPPLPLNPPPTLASGLDDDKQSRSIFEGASKYDILSYLVDAKERGIVPEDSYTFNFNNNESITEEDESKDKESVHERQSSDLSSRVSQLSNASDSSEDNSLVISNNSNDSLIMCKKSSSEIERNDSGVGSETSKSSRSRWQAHNIPPNCVLDKDSPIHLCEDCDSAVETQVTDSGVIFAPLVCRKCSKKRAERKEIITEIIETEEKYGRDLLIILEEFYKPMLVAGLLTSDQLSTIFLNVEELLENNQIIAEKLRDALEIAVEQGDEDLLTVNIGKLMLECSSMLHAFSTYCIRQGAASMLLASLEKEKELLRIFLRVSQMENTVLRRMNLNSFLMVPVQRVTKYPLLLSRLYKVTPQHVEGRELLRQSQQKIELHLTHMNSEAKDMTSLKLWRRISSGSVRRSSSEIDMTNIKLRKMAVDVLEWNHEDARFVMEGKLLYTQPNDSNWRKGRTIKLTPINALLVTIGKPTMEQKSSGNSRSSGECSGIGAGSGTGVREATLLLIREKGGRYSLLREPLFLDRVVVAAEPDWDDYFEVQEITSKDTFIFKAELSARTLAWRGALQRLCRGAGAWRRRRPALANIMINGMLNRH